MEMNKWSKIVIAVIVGAIFLEIFIRVYWSYNDTAAKVFSWLDQQPVVEQTFGSTRDYHVTKQVTLFDDRFERSNYSIYTIRVDGSDSTGVVTVRVAEESGDMSLVSLKEP